MESSMNAFKDRWQTVFGDGAANLALRIVVMFFGLICIACGIALAKLAAMGTAPISSLPAVLTEFCERTDVPMTMGAWTFVFNLIFFLIEIILLRRQFNPIQLLQIPLFVVLSVAVDGWLGIFSAWPPMNYLHQLVYLFISIIFLGFGIRVQLAANLLMSPGDAVVQVIAYVSGRRFGRCKVAWDVTLMCLAVLASLLLLGGLYQVREGTVIAALLVGRVVRLFDIWLRPLAWLVPKTSRVLVPPLCPVVD